MDERIRHLARKSGFVSLIFGHFFVLFMLYLKCTKSKISAVCVLFDSLKILLIAQKF